jgi:hypothetical protein
MTDDIEDPIGEALNKLDAALDIWAAMVAPHRCEPETVLAAREAIKEAGDLIELIAEFARILDDAREARKLEKGLAGE